MKLKDLKSVLRSPVGDIQFSVVYDSKTNTDIESGCSIEFVVEKYGDREVTRIKAFEHMLVIIL